MTSSRRDCVCACSMFAEGSDAFVMSAIKTDSTFFISQYDMFVKVRSCV